MAVTAPVPVEEPALDAAGEADESGFDIHVVVAALAARLHEPVELPSELLGVPLN